MKTTYTHTHDRSQREEEKTQIQTNIGFVCALGRHKKRTSIIHRESVENRTPHKQNVNTTYSPSLKTCYYRQTDSGCVLIRVCRVLLIKLFFSTVVCFWWISFAILLSSSFTFLFCFVFIILVCNFFHLYD